MGSVKKIEASKLITYWVLRFTAAQIVLTMFLDCIFPSVSGTLDTICLSVIAGCISIVSWYFGKALGENKLKIKNGNTSTTSITTENTTKGLQTTLDTIATVASELSQNVTNSDG